MNDSLKLFLFSGSGFNDMGDFNGCNKLSYARYYIIQFNIQPKSQYFGICYLKECDKTYLQNALYKIYDKINVTYPLEIKRESFVIEQTSETHEYFINTYYNGFKVMMYIMFTLISIVIIATLFKISFLKPFDVQSNLKTIFTVNNNNATYAHLRIFDGIRFFSCGWVVFSHVFFVMPTYGTRNLIELYFYVTKWYFKFISSGQFAVDVFFYMSGFMFYFSVQKYFNKDIPRLKIFIASFFLRLFRILPFLLIGIFFIPYVTPFISNGPIYSIAVFSNQGCLKNYWHNLFFISNYFTYSQTDPNDFMCMPTAWYLSCDMQYFIVSMIVVLLFNNNKKARNIIGISAFFFFAALQIFLVVKNKFVYQDYIHDTHTHQDAFDFLYVRSYARVLPYLMGMYFCELFLETDLYKIDYNKPKVEIKKKPELELGKVDSEMNVNVENKNTQQVQINYTQIGEGSDEEYLGNSNIYAINKFIQKRNWLAVIILIIAMSVIHYQFWNSSRSNIKQFTLFWSAMNNTFARVFFILGLGTIVHLTFLGKFDVIRRILTMRIASAISKSTYGIYIIHYALLLSYYYSYDTFFYMNFCDMVVLSFGVFTILWGISLLLGLLIESPFIVLSKKLFKK